MHSSKTGLRVTPGIDDRPIAQIKTCPRCGARLFADMDVCYGCLYDFTRVQSMAPELPGANGTPWSDEELMSADNPDSDLSLEPGIILDEVPLDEVWEVRPDQTAFLDTPPMDVMRLGLLVRSSSMDVMLPLERAGVTVGRGEDNDIVLHMRTVSRSHLRVVPQADGVLVLDQGAINLAHANGLPVEGQCHVGIGGHIDICGVRLGVVGLDG